MKTRQRLSKYMFLALVMVCAMTMLSYASVVVENSPDCTDLMAGQFTDAGDVCFEVSGDNFVVTYTTQDGWELNEVQLWVGDTLGDMPHNAQDNPKIGNFPYKASELGGITSYSFSIPLSSLGGPDYGTTLCDQSFFAAAHASVQKLLPDGTYQTETGWSSGPQISSAGSWATYSEFGFDCVPDGPDCPPAPTPPGDCDTPIGG